MEVLAQDADPQAPFWLVEHLEKVDSTNNVIKAAIATGAPEGICFVAREQVGAYGRQGRTWSSPRGGLYFSFILDPIDAHPQRGKALADLPTTSLVVSLALCQAIERFAGTDAIKIKWPNDLVVVSAQGWSKLCGISLEVVKGKLCIGVGVNVFRPDLDPANAGSELFEEECCDDASGAEHVGAGMEKCESAPYAFAYLEEFMNERACLAGVQKTDQASYQEGSQDVNDALLFSLLEALLDSICESYELWLAEGIEPFLSAYEGLLFNKGEEVKLETIQGSLIVQGIVRGVAPNGELVLETADGQIVQAASGEVHTRVS